MDGSPSFRVQRLSALVVAVGALALTLRSDDAHAAWPPPLSADFKDPANWPNDPGYAGRWNYWSFLPNQQPNTSAYLDADKKLGASGMSVDKAWSLTIGRPEVRIAVLDSGIEWNSPDIVNKAWLNPGELKGAHKPQDKAGLSCGGTGALAGYDCNGDGVFNVADYRDDPRVTPIDPKQKCLQDMDPYKPPTATPRMIGDRNANCLLDAGDIIEMFTDGVDDDANGFTDDISGWDFYRNDNNPYDDTRYGHGTGEANDSSAEGNNKMDGIGTCPLCTFIPLRVGNSFITDVNNFGLAVVYATDNGAKVIQEALGTISNTAFAKTAIDFAYAHGVTIIASMADENSRHHNMPSASNHVLPVHSLRYEGGGFDTSTTFLSFDSCTNYGGHGALSVSGTSCASEATGRGSGIAGLLYSLALSLPQPVNLSAEEVMQSFKMSADDIDVPESRVVDADGNRAFYESKPGWDQRFNYGRMNAFRVVSNLKAGKIPPEVDIVSPVWYQPIYADRGISSVPIFGRVAASRASSYDYVVEWAPGVEPEDKDFTPLMSAVKNVPSSTISGGASVPLASFDPRQAKTPSALDPDRTHAPDPDSPRRCNDDKTYCWGPNDRTITLRIRATAHYGSDAVNGEARRTISVTNQSNGPDDDLLPGFPIDMGSSGEGSSKLADIDGDGVRDIVIASSDGTLHVYSLRGGQPKDIVGFPFRTKPVDGLDGTQTDPNVPSYLNSPAFVAGKNGGIDADIAREGLMNAPAVADLDGDGKPEIVISTWPGTIYVIDHTGKSISSAWPHRLPLVPSCPLDPAKPKASGDCSDIRHDFARGAYASPVVVDMNKDGKLDIVQAAFDGNIYVFNLDGSLQSGWPVRLHSPRTEKFNRIMSTPVPVDLNKDGIPELVSGSNEEVGGGGATGPMFAVDGRGMNAPGGPYLPNWPFIRTSLHLFPVVAEGINAAPAAADFDGDGVGDILVQGNGAPPLVVKADPGKQGAFEDPPNRLPVHTDDKGVTITDFDPTSRFGIYNHADIAQDTMFPLFSQPSIGDLDQDGVPDVVMSGGSLSLIGTLAGGGKPRKSQHLLTAWSGKTGAMMPGLPIVLEDFQFLINHAIADINGDDYPEIITGTGAYYLHAADACGREPKSWPKFTNGWIASSPSVGDINGDGMLDVVSATRDGFLFAWKTTGSEHGVIQWESNHHDNQNTGNYSNALDQGVYKRAAKVIDCTPPPTAPKDGYDAGGGCSTSAVAAPRGSNWLVILSGVALVIRRRRRPAMAKRTRKPLQVGV